MLKRTAIMPGKVPPRRSPFAKQGGGPLDSGDVSL